MQNTAPESYLSALTFTVAYMEIKISGVNEAMQTSIQGDQNFLYKRKVILMSLNFVLQWVTNSGDYSTAELPESNAFLQR